MAEHNHGTDSKSTMEFGTKHKLKYGSRFARKLRTEQGIQCDRGLKRENMKHTKRTMREWYKEQKRNRESRVTEVPNGCRTGTRHVNFPCGRRTGMDSEIKRG